MISLKSTRVGVLIYDECLNLQQVIFSPSIPQVVEKIKIDDYTEDGVSGVITSSINMSVKLNIEAPIPILAPSAICKRVFFLKAFYAGDTLWQERIDELFQAEEIKQKEKDEKRLRNEIAKEERSKIKERKERLIRARKESKDIRKENNNFYIATFVYKDTGEIYMVYNAATTKMIAYKSGISKQKVSSFYDNPILLKSNKRKHIQKAIEERGLYLKIDRQG